VLPDLKTAHEIIAFLEKWNGFLEFVGPPLRSEFALLHGGYPRKPVIPHMTDETLARQMITDGVLIEYKARTDSTRYRLK
jgi:hypothetical protein